MYHFYLHWVLISLSISLLANKTVTSRPASTLAKHVLA